MRNMREIKFPWDPVWRLKSLTKLCPSSLALPQLYITGSRQNQQITVKLFSVLKKWIFQKWCWYLALVLACPFGKPTEIVLLSLDKGSCLFFVAHRDGLFLSWGCFGPQCRALSLSSLPLVWCVLWKMMGISGLKQVTITFFSKANNPRAAVPRRSSASFHSECSDSTQACQAFFPFLN